MPVVSTVTLLVKNLEKSVRFYEKSLGYVWTRENLLVGFYGQSLRLQQVSDGPTGGCMVLHVDVPDLDAAETAFLQNGGGRSKYSGGKTPLYVGLDGELIMLRQRGLPKVPALKLIVYDFDGVLTDNRVFVDQAGGESVAANRSDGLGISMIRKLGIEQTLLSTETNPVVSARAAKLDISVMQAVTDKAAMLTKMVVAREIAFASVLFMGNDINDLGAMTLCGFKVAPADAHPSVCALADYVTEARGGHGAVRELADVIMAGRRF
ncbi:HAD hydrolase family protein [Pseudodesulfovibrio piezophilus]|uniref:Low specificity phosphatase (HAD superfamily)-like protein n=1 Tax=Pseudodesulfovibrio piezophilus (strain DSM 21447 / JCM 15486 / C1TLV30) TaxID=1322246 RepID=M1WTD3_PSEP2|nr:HAD hydrolase family protein [Pseudodesulfovibrio piezophilus]CCH49462.1 Low specificity phosphatase (HAD superfamily)-like protein [Pseudodesulfovibrio piezophilus C1TLV30]